MTVRDPAILERRLNAFEAAVRRDALAALESLHGRQLPPAGDNVNMHCHSFFSYQAQGWSPSRIAWEARKSGWYAAALCDFDVLDGMEEFHAAGQALGLRTAVHVETRAFVPELANVDINSPGEPGVTYIMGGAFPELPTPDSIPGKALARFRQAARSRNAALIARINPKLDSVGIDYERDVLPLTPAGAPTERHIVTAYLARAEQRFPSPARRAAFWKPLLKLADEGELVALEADRPALEERVRAALAKRGGIGYEPPGVDSFPVVDAFISWVRSCNAIPLLTWLDGTSAGEADADALLELFVAKGCAGANIIPDRNWNLRKPEEKARKTALLAAFVRACDARHLPLNIGTEMNRHGLPVVDDLTGPELAPYAESFRRGACVMVGHTLLARYAAMPYLGNRATAEYPKRAARNAFFAAVGALPPLTREMADTLLDAGSERAGALLHAAVSKSGSR